MILSNFAERLSGLIFEANLMPTAFAKTVGLGRSTVNNYLNKRKMPALDVVIKIADFFQCTTDFLLGLEEESYSHTFQTPPPFKERLQAILISQNLSKAELIRKAKLPESGVYFWLRGARKPTIESVVSIATALGRSVEYVLGRSDL